MATMRYLKMKPGLLVFTVALLASISVHLPVYQALGVLAEVLMPEGPPSSVGPTVVEFELAAEEDGSPPAVEEEPSKQKVRAADEPSRPSQSAPKRRAKTFPKKPALAVRKQASPPPKVKAVAPEPDKLSVEQKSDDPSVKPPADADFLAAENRRVKEETVAKIRNQQLDAPQPQVASKSGAADEEVGDGEESVVADLQEVEGEDTRMATVEEAAIRPAQPAQAMGSGSREGTSLPQEKSVVAKSEQAQVARGAVKSGGDETTIVINDGHGTLVIRRPKVGRGPGDEGGAQPLGERTVAPGQRRRSSGAAGADLKMGYRQFEQTFGAEELARQRAAYAAQRKSVAAGSSRGKRWRRFRAAIENYAMKVKPGEQTALNAAASPFAAYIAAIHRRIHVEYALKFIQTLAVLGGPFDDRTLRTKLEIVINRDGTLHQVGVVETSGLVTFDFGAFDAVMRAGPFARPPAQILSSDDKVYVHWGFYRNARACGTFNSSPFILKRSEDSPVDVGDDPLPSPPVTPGPPPHNHLGTEWGAVVPRRPRGREQTVALDMARNREVGGSQHSH